LTPASTPSQRDILITKDITLEGGPDDVFIFQCTTDVAQSVNTKVMSGGVQAKNVVWQNAGSVKIQPVRPCRVLSCVLRTLPLRLAPP
jgi:hypothetical protein